MRTPTLPGRRRAAEFDDALSGRRESRDWVVRDLVRTVETLRGRPPVTPDPQFTADLRVRVLAAAERDLARLPEQGRTRPPVSGPVGMPLRRRVGLAAAASLFVLVGGSAGIASASTQAMPGDLLYPVKRGVEQTQVALDRTDGARGRTLVGQADTRLSELHELTTDGQQPDNDALVVDTLHTFTDQAEEGGDALLAAYASGDTGAVHTLDEFTVGAGKALTDMSGTLPAEAQGSYTAAAGTIASLQGQVSEVCRDCSAATAVHIPVELLASASTLLPTDGLTSGDSLLAGGLPGEEFLDAPSGSLPDVDPGDLPPGAGGDPGTDPGDDPLGDSGDDPLGDSGDPDGSGGGDSGLPGGDDGDDGGDGSGDDGGDGSGDDGSGGLGETGDAVDGLVGGLLGGADGDSGDGPLGTVGDGVDGILDDVPIDGPLDGVLGGGDGGDGGDGDDGGLLGGLGGGGSGGSGGGGSGGGGGGGGLLGGLLG